MINIAEEIQAARNIGYEGADAPAKVCQDIILLAISKSSLNRNITIKGGVVMRSITGNSRRATQDLDLDFIRYSLSDESIDRFVSALNSLEGISIKRVGSIAELKQQDYKGKRIYVEITDSQGEVLKSKIDIGVHNRLEIEQEEYCFDIAFDSDGAYLLINSKEQMFTEKLRSLLKFGRNSKRPKDVFDMYYHCDSLDSQKLMTCIDTYIINDESMRENSMDDINNRIRKELKTQRFMELADTTDRRWLDDDINLVMDTIIEYLSNLR